MLLGRRTQVSEAAATLAATLAASKALRRRAQWMAFLPAVRRLWPAAPVTAGVGLVALLEVALDSPGADPGRWLAAWVAGAILAILAAIVARHAPSRRPRVRLAVVGPQATADRLAADLGEVPGTAQQVVGRIGPGPGLGEGRRRPPKCQCGRSCDSAHGRGQPHLRALGYRRCPMLGTRHRWTLRLQQPQQHRRHRNTRKRW